MHIPARYYKRIPKFYFIVGILLVITSFNMDENPFASYLYFIAGLVSVIYAVSVHQARRRRRRSQPPDDFRPAAVDEPPVADKRQPFINDNAPPAEDRPLAEQAAAPAQETPEQADNKRQPGEQQQSRTDTEERELPQHGSSVPSPAQSELKP